MALLNILLRIQAINTWDSIRGGFLLGERERERPYAHLIEVFVNCSKVVIRRVPQ